MQRRRPIYWATQSGLLSWANSIKFSDQQISLNNSKNWKEKQNLNDLKGRRTEEERIRERLSRQKRTPRIAFQRSFGGNDCSNAPHRMRLLNWWELRVERHWRTCIDSSGDQLPAVRIWREHRRSNKTDRALWSSDSKPARNCKRLSWRETALPATTTSFPAHSVAVDVLATSESPGYYSVNNIQLALFTEHYQVNGALERIKKRITLLTATSRPLIGRPVRLWRARAGLCAEQNS